MSSGDKFNKESWQYDFRRTIRNDSKSFPRLYFLDLEGNEEYLWKIINREKIRESFSILVSEMQKIKL